MDKRVSGCVMCVDTAVSQNNLTDADRIVIDMTGVEDEEAGDLGVPFTQTQGEDDEEWDEVNWGQVELVQQTRCAGDSGAGGLDAGV